MEHALGRARDHDRGRHVPRGRRSRGSGSAEHGALEGQRDEVGGGERAALSIEIGGSDGAAIQFEIRNHGREHGVVRQIDFELGHEAPLPSPTRTQIPAGELNERSVIAGGQTLRREHATDGKPLSYVRGVIFYEDARGERHHTTFCRVLDPARGLVAPSRPGYNYGD